MADSIPEKIMSVFESRINAAYATEPIFVGDGLNDVFRPTRRGGVQVNNKSIVLVHGDSEWSPELSAPGNPPLMAYQMLVMIHCVISPSEADTTAIETEMDNFAAHVHNAVATGAGWQGLDGNAIDTRLGAIRKIDPEDESSRGVVLEYLVIYRVEETDMFQEVG